MGAPGAAPRLTAAGLDHDVAMSRPTRLFAFHGGWEDVDHSALTLLERIGEKVTVPYQYFLVEHPSGRMMFDTGASPRAAREPDRYPPTQAWGARVTEQDLAPSRLAEVGLKPELIDLVLSRKIDPGRVFDLTLPLDQIAEGYRAMDERRAIKVLLRP